MKKKQSTAEKTCQKTLALICISLQPKKKEVTGCGQSTYQDKNLKKCLWMVKGHTNRYLKQENHRPVNTTWARPRRSSPLHVVHLALWTIKG